MESKKNNEIKGTIFNKKTEMAKFKNYINDFLKVGLSIGTILGVMALASGIAGGDVTANLYSLKLEGAIAGIYYMFFIPVIVVVNTFILGVVTYIPSKMIISLIKKSSIYNAKS